MEGVACVTAGVALPGQLEQASCSGGAADGGCDLLDAHRTHHLLKHCLSNNQKGEALHHFNTSDVKEAARDISRMGQRELQSKFRCVYGSVTHSNNNDWLRRKLYEAIGAAPLKSATKGKARKATAGASKPRRSADHASAHAHAPAGERRRRSADSKSSPSAVFGASAALRLKRSLPSSPLLPSSVLDVHRFASNDTTTSESEDGSLERLGDIHAQSPECLTPRSPAARSASLASLTSLHVPSPVHIRPARTHVGLVPVRPLGAVAAPASPPAFLPHSAFPGTAMHQSVGSLDPVREFAQLQSQPGSLSHSLQASRAWTAGLPALQPAPLPFQPMPAPAATADWQNEAWADLTNLSFTPLSFDLKTETLTGDEGHAPKAGMEEEEDDVLLLQLDLSAFDEPHSLDPSVALRI